MILLIPLLALLWAGEAWACHSADPSFACTTEQKREFALTFLRKQEACLDKMEAAINAAEPMLIHKFFGVGGDDVVLYRQGTFTMRGADTKASKKAQQLIDDVKTCWK